MLQFIPENANKVLDVGCGEGTFGGLIKSVRDVEVWGVEICKDAAVLAEIKLDKVLVGTIEECSKKLPFNYFDCVIFNDVLEHLIDPWIVLKEIKSTIKQDGYVLSSIPNVRYYDNVKKLIIDKQWRYDSEGILDKTHLRFFTIESIREMFASCGYQIIRIEGIRDNKLPWKFRIINNLFGKMFEDMRYLQFACLAKLG